MKVIMKVKAGEMEDTASLPACPCSPHVTMGRFWFWKAVWANWNQGVKME